MTVQELLDALDGLPTTFRNASVDLEVWGDGAIHRGSLASMDLARQGELTLTLSDEEL